MSILTDVKNYDGLYFIPVENGIEIAYFTLVAPFANGRAKESTDIGDKFYLAFFKPNEKGEVVFDEHFEAILGDPTGYVNNLMGSNLSGCIVRKTTRSGKWFREYLKDTTEKLKEFYLQETK